MPGSLHCITTSVSLLVSELGSQSLASCEEHIGLLYFAMAFTVWQLLLLLIFVILCTTLSYRLLPVSLFPRTTDDWNKTIRLAKCCCAFSLIPRSVAKIRDLVLLWSGSTVPKTHCLRNNKSLPWNMTCPPWPPSPPSGPAHSFANSFMKDMLPLPPCPPHTWIRLKSTKLCAYKSHHNHIVSNNWHYTDTFTINEAQYNYKTNHKHCLSSNAILTLNIYTLNKTSGYATWFTAGGAIRIGHYDVIDDVITRKL